MTKRSKKSKDPATKQSNHSLTLKSIDPITDGQISVFEHYLDQYNLMLYGYAGTGKTFTALALALHSVLVEQEYKKVMLVRSCVASRDVGYMPGTLAEKAKMFEAPYYALFAELFGRDDAYEIMKQKKYVQFETTSYVRGATYDDVIIIVDECQNMTFQELNSVITRCGENARIIFCGDFRQTDLHSKWDVSGLDKFIKIVGRMKSFKLVEFKVDDIVRSGLVREYIIAQEEYEAQNVHPQA